MYTLSSWQAALLTSWAEVWSSFLRVLPSIVGAIVVFAIGLILAYWVKRLIVQGLKLIKFEAISEKIGIDKYLSKADIRFTFIELIGTIAEWLIILVFFLAVVDVLGLSAVSMVLASVLGYLPNVLAAALIFAAGYIVAGLAGGLVRGALVSVDHDLARPVGRLSRWVIMLVAFFAAVDQLQIARGLIQTFFQGLTYTVVLILGLSVGLGAKDLVSKILDDWYEKIKK
ncbi:MAG: Conserved cytoplasmic membrane protein, CmpX protein [Candidatus Woesebacteria bacterium GW2011_GWA1_45_8]|uniref:Conserved cytoplasmic membrane protein, CmpX protein n=1 Tax=Candidatus Woesebacteria bacterium GW2011_GWA1_45_8 TaxID=1618559 RepID=A0A0G1MVY3_9BACT|nr:MAG: Conserved cytoplasmic membrane protein, CmpX protein [Candidatus Woesebacteria bacterium GW2011_GWA1_45_8]